MASWPNHPVAVLEVFNWGFPDGVDAFIRDWASTYSAVMNDSIVRWHIELWFTDYGTRGANWDTCGATFEWVLERSASPEGPWYSLAGQMGSRHIGTGNGSDETSKIGVAVEGTIGSDISYFRLKLRCYSTNYGAGSDKDSGWTYIGPFTVVNQQSGTFYLDYLPVTIVYCPPEQDMSAWLRHGAEFGTVGRGMGGSSAHAFSATRRGSATSAFM
jgi:hypothetical protein